MWCLPQGWSTWFWSSQASLGRSSAVRYPAGSTGEAHQYALFRKPSYKVPKTLNVIFKYLQNISLISFKTCPYDAYKDLAHDSYVASFTSLTPGPNNSKITVQYFTVNRQEREIGKSCTARGVTILTDLLGPAENLFRNAVLTPHLTWKRNMEKLDKSLKD